MLYNPYSDQSTCRCDRQYRNETSKRCLNKVDFRNQDTGRLDHLLYCRSKFRPMDAGIQVLLLAHVERDLYN